MFRPAGFQFQDWSLSSSCWLREESGSRRLKVGVLWNKGGSSASNTCKASGVSELDRTSPVGEAHQRENFHWLILRWLCLRISCAFNHMFRLLIHLNHLNDGNQTPVGSPETSLTIQQLFGGMLWSRNVRNKLKDPDWCCSFHIKLSASKETEKITNVLVKVMELHLNP